MEANYPTITSGWKIGNGTISWGIPNHMPNGLGGRPIVDSNDRIVKWIMNAYKVYYSKALVNKLWIYIKDYSVLGIGCGQTAKWPKPKSTSAY